MNKERAASSPTLETKISRLQENFRQAFMSHGEPLSYCNTFIRAINNQHFENAEEEYKFKIYSFADEINLIKQGESFPQVVKKLINQREEIIRQLRSELIGNRYTKQLNLSTACEKLENIRMYGLMIIEKIYACKKKFKVRDSTYFTEILQRLGQDVDFLRLTALRKYIEFSNHNDPLFMVPYRKFWSLEHIADNHRRPIIDLFTLDVEYQKRLETADKFIKSTQKKDEPTLSLLKEIESKAIIERTIEEEQVNAQNNQNYASTLQKFTLPSLRNKNKIDDAYVTQSKTKEIVSNLIKEVISDYKTKGKERNIRSIEYKKKLSRSIDRSADIIKQEAKETNDPKANNIRYRIGKTSSLRPHQIEKSIYEDDVNHERNSRGRILRPTHKLPYILRDDRSFDKVTDFEKYLQNQSYQIEKQQSTQPKQIVVRDIEIKKNSRIRSGKIRFNQFNKMHTYTQPTQRNDTFNRFQPINDHRMDRNSLNSIPNAIIYHEKIAPSKVQLDPSSFVRQSPSPQMEKIETPPQLNKKYQQQFNIINNQSKINVEPQIKSNRFCKISQQFSYSQVMSNTANKKVEEKSIQKEESRQQINKSTNKIKQVEKQKKLKINFQYNQQIYCPPYTPPQNLKVANPKKQDFTANYNSQRFHIPHIKQANDKVQSATVKESSNPPFSIRSFNKQSEPYNMNPIDEEIENENMTSNRTSLNKSQNKALNSSAKNENLKQSEIKTILEESEKSDSFKKSDSSFKNANEFNKNSNKSSNNSKQSVPSAENSIPVSHASPNKNQNTSNQPPTPIKDQTAKEETLQSSNILQKQKIVPNNADQMNLKLSNSPSPRDQSSSFSFHPPENAPILPNYSDNHPTNNPPKTALDKSTIKAEDSNRLNKSPVNNSIVRMTNFTPQLESSPTQRKNIMKEQPKPSEQLIESEKAAQILQKCAFQSKSIKHKDLLQQIKKLTPQKFPLIKALIEDKFFNYRHLILTNCLFDNQICGFCISYPHISSSARTVFILDIQVIKQKFLPLQVPLINTFIKYIFINDPCQGIAYLNHATLTDEKNIKQLKNYEGLMKFPFKINKIEQNAFKLIRKDVKCAKQEEYTSVLSFINLFAAQKQNAQLKLKEQKHYLSAQYLKKIQKRMQKQAKMFVNANQLQTYLDEEDLPKFKVNKFKQQIYFTNYLLEECLVRSKFFVYSKQFYFTVDYPHTSLFEGKSAYYLSLATGVSNKYFILSDKLYENVQINLLENFRSELQGNQFDRIFGNQKFNNKLVTCPTFRKQYEVQLSECNSLTAIEFNWKDYIKGVRYVQEDEIYLELVTPFFFGLIEINEEKKIQLLSSTIVEQTDLIK